MAAKQSAYLTFDGESMWFDAVFEESGEFVNTVTTHPVEEGANVADHVRSDPATLTLNVGVSNQPIKDVNNAYGGSFNGVDLNVPKPDRPFLPTPGALFQAVASAAASLLGGQKSPTRATVLTWPSEFNAVKDLSAKLLDWKERGVVGTVVTSWRSFPSMIITRVTTKRNAPIGDGAELTIELKEIRVVESKLVTAPVPTEVRGRSMVRKGAQNPKPATAPEEKESVIFQIKETALGRR